MIRNLRGKGDDANHVRGEHDMGDHVGSSPIVLSITYDSLAVASITYIKGSRYRKYYDPIQAVRCILLFSSF